MLSLLTSLNDKNLFLSSVNCYRAFPSDAVGEYIQYIQYIQNTATNLQGIWISAVQDPARSKWPAFSSSYEGGYRGTP